MSETSQRTLHIPSWQISYLEKHRLYDLFHELGRELVINQPEDHVLYLKQILINSVKSRDNSRAIFLSSPKINCLEIAKSVAVITNQIIITEESLLPYVQNTALRNSKVKAKLIAQLVRRDRAHSHGWILVNCIKTEKEGRALLELGILPTHVIHFIPSFFPSLRELQYCHVSVEWPTYRKTIMELRNEIYIQQRALHEIVTECVDLLKIKSAKFAMKPRILILGPRGSGRKTQAKILAQELKLVHIDFERLLCEKWMSESEIGVKLRSCKNDVCLHSELLAEVIHKRVLESDCLKNGWVLTGFPFTKKDFEYLDCIYTPPNKVIFLECDLCLCKKRLLNRKINVYTGSVVNVIEDGPLYDETVLKSHVKDDNRSIDAEISYYCEHYGEIKEYCGNTAYYINGNQDIRWIFETIMAILTRAPEPCELRKPFHIKTPSTSSDACCCSPIPSNVWDCFNAKL